MGGGRFMIRTDFYQQLNQAALPNCDKKATTTEKTAADKRLKMKSSDIFLTLGLAL